MKRFILLWLIASLYLGPGDWAKAQELLALEAKIPLGEVKGRIDHLATDAGRHRLFIAELGNDTVGVVDVDQRKVIHVISGLKEPQGVAYVPSGDTLYVSNAGDGSVRMFKGADFGEVGRIALGDDADNIRVDTAANQVFVGYGSGALAVLDAANGRKIADIALGGHPESFQLDKNSPRIFVNVPSKQLISVVDRANGNHLATWATGNGTHFAMVLNDAVKQLFVALRTPAKLAVFAMDSDAVVASVETCGDIDDMFMDAKRGRLYVTCGEGFVDVFDARSPYPRLSRIATVPGARTALFVPETDRLYVAARPSRDQPATVWVFRPVP